MTDSHVTTLTCLCSVQVVEGDAPLPLGSTCRRKRLRSAGEEDGEETRRSCASRPNPEGSLSASELSRYGKPEEEEGEGEELQRLCQRCHIMASQLRRQAAALADPAALKVRNTCTDTVIGQRGQRGGANSQAVQGSELETRSSGLVQPGLLDLECPPGPGLSGPGLSGPGLAGPGLRL